MVDSTYIKRQMGQSNGVSIAVSHNQTAANVCKQFNGKVIKHLGDSIMVVFNTPLEGTLAALEFIRRINEDKLPFRTKIGLVQGIVTRMNVNGTDYLGHAVNRCSRITGQALPNQILTDETTMELINPFLGDFKQMISRFLGMHPLKSIGNVPIYEIGIPSYGFIDKDTTPPVQSDPSPAGQQKIGHSSKDRLQLPALALPEPVAAEIIKDPPLAKVLESCTLSDLELDAVSTAYQNLKHLLEKSQDLQIRQILLSGTFSRGTMIKPLQTIDIMVLIAQLSGQQCELEEIMSRLEKLLYNSYPGLDIVNEKSRLIIPMQDIDFAVTPVLAVMDKGHGQLIMPSIDGNFWLSCNPAAPGQWMEKAISRNGPEFLPFLRLIKAWQRVNCDFAESFHIELLTDLIASKTKLGLSFESVYEWFWYTYNLLLQNKKPFIREPNRPNIYADAYIYMNSITFNRFSRAVTDSYNAARQGINLHRAGETAASMSKWRQLFGSYLD